MANVADPISDTSEPAARQLKASFRTDRNMAHASPPLFDKCFCACGEALMSITEELRDAGEKFKLLSLYQRFEHVVVLILTALIAVIVVAAIWNLSLKILFGLVLSGSLDPSDYSAFQAVFGMIFTVIIALEFKKSLLVMTERRDSVVQIRSVVLIALLALCRKVIILDLVETDAMHTMPLAAAILALGVVYWLIRVSDQSLDNTA
jgi:uncharacterized membrane protein (DUF373 family)